MITDQRVRNIALFYFFAFLDEKTAFEAAHRTVSGLKSAQTSDHAADISAMRKGLEQFRKSAARNRSSDEFDSLVELPPSIDFAAWKRFHRTSPENETIAVVLSKVLKYSDEAIARGLRISLGTARYRIGKGVRGLGEALRKA